MKKILIHINYLRYGIRNKYIRPKLKYRDYPFSEDNVKRLSDFLASSGSDAAVAFVGLRQIKHSLGLEDPYTFMSQLLLDSFATVIVPTFTGNVLETGVFDVLRTPTENGTFSQLFLQQADIRTLCPFKSYAVKGSRCQEILALDTLNDYSPNGSFEYIHQQDIVTINLGTIDTRPCCTHYAEFKSKLPYLLPRKVKVSVTDTRGETSTNEYFYLDNNMKIKLNLDKVERDLLKAGLARKLTINDMVARILPEQKYFDYLLHQLKRDPYYLVY